MKVKQNHNIGGDEMTELTWRVRLAVLWIFLAVAAATGLALLLYEPETARHILRADELYGVDMRDPSTQVATASQVIVPLGMAFTTLAVRDRGFNRRLNGVVGAVYAAMALVTLVAQLAEPFAFMVAVMFLVALILLWHVWKWPVPSRAVTAADETVSAGR